MTSNGTPHRSAIPSEVGWQFVPQYYNFVNKEPERLHCFYNKRSTFIHGSEGEDSKTCHGQQEIHAQISSLNFQDCKIFINSVDAQSSADGGIIIQVIGELSNNNGPWQKFVQTFFLAEQPNGYFVLNDIFRFLKEDAVEGDSDEVASDSVSAPEPVAVPAEYPREPSPPPSPPVEVVDATAAPVEEPPVTVAEIAEPEPLPAPVPDELTATHLNGYEVEKPATPAPVSRTPTPEPTPDVAPTPPPAAAVIAPSPSPTPAPAASATTSAPPAPAAAPVPKTWANLAASNTKKWGNAVAHDSRGSSENVSSSPAVASTSGSQTPVKPSGAPSRTPHPAYAAAQSVTTAQCFIKSVTEPISSQALTQALTRFGPLKGTVEIVRYKACAFAEFTTVDAARRAIILSLPPVAGGEGGVKVDIGGGETLKIIVETKKERGDRPASRGRGGPPFAGEGRGASSSDGRGGGFRGSARGSGRGRGAK
ncbi:hypothetical protein F5879DRAFT_972346 [Lentinula edodes]|uniref:uncharacterized protein n=1 Tax=Lentinula edodes TaxID=5353 RepID=UPI001E8D2A20|nr:uncharacterized protein C8R40DRAFT_1148996 [Lentinula edodes]KAH7873709.1 hypothetical protein C8R40DRAFT_1148996 [Lentinula edodes]KAJ3900538.1 hypothetical protein F5879DRAFT_972346 [Lentinula edodes]